MPIKCELLLSILSTWIKFTAQSITGLTYMDPLDFEERYRDVNECNPFHWYPLHLPPHCLTMYEELIRKGTPSFNPVRIVKDRETDLYNVEHSATSREEYPYSGFQPYRLQEIEETRYMTPYEKMFYMLRKDVQKEPSAPQITFLPGFGVVALYKQPISVKSGQYIKEVSSAYRDANSELMRFYQVPTTCSTDKKEEIDESKNNSTEVLRSRIGNSKLITIFKSKKL